MWEERTPFSCHTGRPVSCVCGGLLRGGGGGRNRRRGRSRDRRTHREEDFYPHESFFLRVPCGAISSFSRFSFCLHTRVRRRDVGTDDRPISRVTDSCGFRESVCRRYVRSGVEFDLLTIRRLARVLRRRVLRFVINLASRENGEPR